MSAYHFAGGKEAFKDELGRGLKKKKFLDDRRWRPVLSSIYCSRQLVPTFHTLSISTMSIFTMSKNFGILLSLPTFSFQPSVLSHVSSMAESSAPASTKYLPGSLGKLKLLNLSISSSAWMRRLRRCAQNFAEYQGFEPLPGFQGSGFCFVDN